MRNLNTNFQNRTINYKKLEDYGFVDNKGLFSYEKNIFNNTFKVVVNICESNQLSKIIDLTTRDEYVLVDISKSSGDFVGLIREQYEDILNDIVNKCSTLNVFKSKQAKLVINYIKEKYNDDLEYLWAKFPNTAVWRNKDNNKWYGLLVVLEESKLGIESSKVIDVIGLRYQKDSIREIIDNEKVFAGYHMNKNNWISIKLDGSIDIDKIYEFIDNSYCLSINQQC